MSVARTFGILVALLALGIDPLPSAWEYFFHQLRGFYVRIHLKTDGKVLGGL